MFKFCRLRIAFACLVGLALLISEQGFAQQPAVNAATPSIEARLASGRADLTRIDLSLERQDLNDAALAGLRADVEPIAKLARSLIDEVLPRQALVKARLDPLITKSPAAGDPAADDKTAPENPTLVADRDQQQKIYDSLDVSLKQARILQVDVEQAITRIGARRRDLFARKVFSRTDSILDLALWMNALREIPADAAAIATIARDWFSSVSARLGSGYALILVALLTILGVFYRYAGNAARRLLSREPATDQPSELAKVLAAFLVAIVTAAVPIICVSVLSGALHVFGLVAERIDPVLFAFVAAVTRVSLTAGLGRGLLSPDRANWRLLDLRDETCGKLLRLSVTIAFIVSAGTFLDAIYDLIAASLPVVVATRGVLAGTIALAMAASLRGIMPEADDSEECLGPRIMRDRDWFGPMRVAAWVVIALILVSVIVGYIAFASFLTKQLVWVSFVGTMLFLLLQLSEHVTSASLQPQSMFGRGVVTSIGLRREAMQQLAAIISGVLHIAFYAIAITLILAPWGIQSDDMLGTLQAAFFEFKVGDVTISPSNIVLAIIMFALCLGATRGLQSWLDLRFLPLTQLDTGLRNSIRTSLGYVGFIVAAAIGLGQVGLDFQKLAIVAGALSVGIGFGLQSIVGNFVSGLIILWERAIRVGDWVVVGDEQGLVRRINVRSTEIETFDRATMIVPNSNLVTGTVKNWVRGDRTGRIRIPLAVPMDMDADLVRTTLIECAKSQETVLRIPAPIVLLTAIGTNDLKFELLVYVGDVETSARAKSELNFEILRRFAAANITIAQSPPTAIVHISGAAALADELPVHQQPPAEQVRVVKP